MFRAPWQGGFGYRVVHVMVRQEVEKSGVGWTYSLIPFILSKSPAMSLYTTIMLGLPSSVNPITTQRKVLPNLLGDPKFSQDDHE